MLVLLNLAKSINPFAPRVAPRTQTRAPSPRSARMGVDRQSFPPRKRSFEDILPSIESDDSENISRTEASGRKRRAVRRNGKNVKQGDKGPGMSQQKREDNANVEKNCREIDDSLEAALTPHTRREARKGNKHIRERRDTGLDCEEEMTGSEQEHWQDSSNTDYETETEEKASSIDPTLGDWSRSPSGQATPHRSVVKRRPNWHSPQSIAHERARRERDIISQTFGWSLADAKLFRVLELRGVQPIISTAWMQDFPALPLALFTSDEDDAFVNALGLRKNYSGDVHGARALMDLMVIGQQVRDRISDPYQSPAETYIKMAIHRYIRWTLTDADIWRRRPYLPLMAVVVAPKNTSLVTLQRRLLKKMRKLKRRWSSALLGLDDACCPPLYGIMICHSVGAIMAPENVHEFGEDSDGGSDDVKDSIRLLTTMDWSEDGQDVWNAFALAILGIHCRNLLLEALEGRVLRNVKIDEHGEGDPDA